MERIGNVLLPFFGGNELLFDLDETGKGERRVVGRRQALGDDGGDIVEHQGDVLLAQRGGVSQLLNNFALGQGLESDRLGSGGFRLRFSAGFLFFGHKSLS